MVILLVATVIANVLTVNNMWKLLFFELQTLRIKVIRYLVGLLQLV